MGWVIGIALIVLVAALFVLPGLSAAGIVAAESKGRKKAEANAEQILDELFATDAPTVTYDTRVYNHLTPTIVLAGAKERGWRLMHDDNGLLLLERDN